MGKTKNNRKLSFGKAGNGIGVRLVLSVPELKKMGLTPENREVIIVYEEDRIIITPAKKNKD